MGRSPFERGIGVTIVADAEHDFGAVAVFLDHLVDGVGIILKVGVHRDAHIRADVQSLHKTGVQRVLMPFVMGEFDAVHRIRILIVKSFDDVPGCILGTVVDEDDPTRHPDGLALLQCKQFASQRRGGNR